MTLQEKVNRMNKFGEQAFKTRVKLSRTRRKYPGSPDKHEWIFSATLDGQLYIIGSFDHDKFNIYENLPRKLFRTTYMYKKYKRGGF